MIYYFKEIEIINKVILMKVIYWLKSSMNKESDNISYFHNL
jgi:hypothetical protein